MSGGLVHQPCMVNHGPWPRGSAEMVAGHPALQQQIGMLTMRAAEELLVRQHAGSAAGQRKVADGVGDVCLLLLFYFWFLMLGFVWFFLE